MQQDPTETWAAFERRLDRARGRHPSPLITTNGGGFISIFARSTAIRLAPFLTKLAAKNQSVAQRSQAYASHWLLANYDLPTIQRLLGHSDIRTTMIFLQTVPSVTLKEAKSPLDCL